ncbi:MAG: hypothetical protein HY824_03245 [Acidobacteria bacterium]|nr:hypothetical protein [Acidobacteriota bacterium]
MCGDLAVSMVRRVTTRRAVMAALGIAAAFVPRPVAAQAPGVETLDVRTVSTRPDTVSGGEVLVQIAVPRAAAPDRVAVTLNGRDIRSAFRPGSQPHILLGLVSGLSNEPNQLQVAAPGQRRVQMTLVNHPAAGPVIAGPHQTPFVCETEAFGFGKARDGDCTVETRVEYFYRTKAAATAQLERPGGNSAAALAAVDAAPPRPGGGNGRDAANPFKPFDPNAPRPADLAETVTSDGRTVPYIVRREMGTINRAVYVIAFLHEPGTPLPDPWTPTPGWNGRLIYSFGGGCRAGYHQGRSIGGLSANRSYLEESQLGDYAIARGYALAGGSLNVFGTTCADVISAETMMMVKEHFIERFGAPRYTIGSGRSGGSMQQHLIANNYPGLLDGIIPTASFADTMTFLVPLYDCELLDRAFSTSALSWTDAQKAAVAGHVSYAYCGRNGTQYPNMRATNCDPDALPAGLVYDPKTNRTGARCTYQDNLVNVFGRDPQTGFARRPFDNVGVQYGLRALNEGTISVDQFLDLNRRVGGHDIDGGIVPERTVADPQALRIAYETGRLNDASGGLSAVPIIDVRPYTDGDDDVHDIVASHITRARLAAANGHAGNQVFRVYAPGTPIQLAQRYTLDAMDQWLSGIARDSAPARSALDKVVRNRPVNLVDTCYTAALEPVTDPGRCRAMFPVAANPRLVAGSPLALDRLKCEVKAVDRADYRVSLTDAQLASLRQVFAGGVCDYSRPGVGQRAPQTGVSTARTDRGGAETWLAFPRAGDANRLARTE